MKLDQLADESNLQLYRLLQGVDLPDFVKDAELDSADSLAPLEKTAYADEVNVAFPINTPARVYVSNAFFQSKKAELSRFGSSHVAAVAEKIKDAADLFSISREIEAFNILHEKRANRDFELKHVCEIEDAEHTEPVLLFPYKTAEDFAKSAQVFAANMSKYPFPWREQVSRSFLAKSAEAGVDELPDIICKYAGLFFPEHTSVLSQELARRAGKMSSKTAKDRLTQLSDAVLDVEFDSVDDVMKVAHIVYCIEQEDGAYDRPKTAELLPDPVDKFFALSATKVAEILNVVDMGGSKFQIEPLKKISADKYKEAFGIDIDPTNEDQLRDILPTMPLSDVSLFQELTGATPV